MKKVIGGTVFFLFTILVCSGFGLAAETIRIGTIFPLSGPMARIGQEAFNAADIVREIVNERGGLWGKKIEYVVGDAPDATAANTEATRLIIKEGVKVILGTYSSALCLAASEVAEREGAIYWETIAVADKITGRGYKNIFRCSHSGSMMGESGANFAEFLAGKLGIQKDKFRIAVISEDSDFGTSVGDGAVNKTKSLGMNLVADERYNKNLTDYSSLVLRLKAAKPDVVIATSYLNDGITIWRQMRELDLNLKAMIGVGTGYALDDFLKAQGKYAEGIFNSDATMTVRRDALSNKAQELIREFVPRFKTKTGHDPGPLAGIALGYAWALLTEVLPEAGSMDLGKIRQAARKMDKPLGSYPTGVGLKFDERGQNTRILLPMMQWQSRKLPVVWPEAFATDKPIMFPLPKWSER